METDMPAQAKAENAFDAPSRRPYEAGRTPYDGLRPWSAITHGIGAVLGLIGTILLAIKTIPHSSGSVIAGFLVYGISMITLYTASTIYHSVNGPVSRRIALRRMDHAAVYLLIAGSYTPVCVKLLSQTAGIVVLAIIWSLALAGAGLSIFWVNMPRKLTAGIYIALGWLSVGVLPFIYQLHGITPIAWLLAGGVLYTIGGVFYAIKWPGRNNPRFGCHEIFHSFIVLGSIVHYLLMYQLA